MHGLYSKIVIDNPNWSKYKITFLRNSFTNWCKFKSILDLQCPFHSLLIYNYMHLSIITYVTICNILPISNLNDRIWHCSTLHTLYMIYKFVNTLGLFQDFVFCLISNPSILKIKAWNLKRLCTSRELCIKIELILKVLTNVYS